VTKWFALKKEVVGFYNEGADEILATAAALRVFTYAATAIP
jgi:hypothetical protein